MAPADPDTGIRPDQIRIAFDALSKAVREMTPVGGRVVPAQPTHSNLLARPHRQTQCCSVCKFPGHQSLSISKAHACRQAIMSTVEFWEDMAAHISTLYSVHEPFHSAIISNKPTYEMRVDNYPLAGHTYEEIFVNRLTCSYLKFQAHFAGIRPKAMAVLGEGDVLSYDFVSMKMNDFLLKGCSLSDLFAQSVEAGQK